MGGIGIRREGRSGAAGWARRFPARRRRQAIALALAVLAVGVAVRDLAGPDDGTVTVVVAAKDVAAGDPIAEADVTVVAVPEEHIPDRAVRRAEDIVGSTPAGPLARGEILTDARFAGVALAQALTGAEDAHIVAVTPRDAGLTPMLRTGDVVDVLAPGPEAGSARPVANGARVVLSDDDGVVLLALPPGAAATVASAGLDLPLTLVLSR
ncbi:SAF domain-containing protein [Corynebacterium sp. NPDC060344]|uniref:SAF domain-containing protein n=1 Tax=Corynebacterium sp. NPDC060344 TaxID=3347101 RepID=UPI0036688DDE